MKNLRHLLVAGAILVVVSMRLLFATSGHCQESQQTALQLYGKAMRTPALSEKTELLKRAVELDPEFKEAVYELGISYFRKGDYQDAIASLRWIHDGEASSFKEAGLYLRNAYTFRAAELNEQESFDAAHAAVSQALFLDADHASALLIMGKIAFNLRDWPAAVQALRRSVDIDPSLDEGWSKLGDALMRQNDYGAAVTAYERAVQLNPNEKQVQFHLNVAARRNRPEAWLTRYRDALQARNIEAAAEILKKAGRAHPDNLIITNRLAEVKSELAYTSAVAAVANHDWENAAKLLEKIEAGYRDTASLQSRVQAALDSVQVRNQSWRKVAKRLRQPQEVATTSLTENRPTSAGTEGAASGGEKPGRPAVNLESGQSTMASDVVPENEQTGPVAIRNARLSGTVTTESLTAEKTVAPHQVRTSAVRQAPGGSSRLPFILSILGGVALFAFIVFRVKFHHVEHYGGTALLEDTLREQDEVSLVPAMHHSAAEFSGDETFHDRIASETPVTFNPIDSFAVLGGDTASELEMPFTDDSSLSLQETRTTQGGIRPVRRIGRYVVESEIGRGSMGMVFKAWDPKLDRTVVIKQMASPEQMQTTEFSRLKDRLYREARAAGKLNHANIVVVYDVEEENSSSFIVMEYLRGSDLKELLEGESDGRLPPARACRIVGQICQALAFAHQNDIVHRDIKPSNIILLDNDQVKVADFGIAKLLHLGTLTQTGDVIGTPFYMSPEQIEGRRVDGRSDIFSTGVLLYEMLTGQRPFDGESISTVVYKIVNKVPKAPSKENTELPTGFDDLIARALTKNPDERYQTATDFLIDLQKLEKFSYDQV